MSMAHIAVIEDSPVLVRFLNDLLVKQGYSVSCYTSGQAALDEMENHPPDLAIVDLGLPDIFGLDLIKKVRLDLRLQDIQVLVLTAQNDLDTRLKGLEDADDFLGKPFEVNELLARVAALLRRRDSQTVRGQLELVGGAINALQMMLVSNSKGALLFDDGATLFLKDGHIVYAEHPKAKGKEAAQQILGRKTGSFRFRPDALPPQENLNISPISFMLELSKDKDEVAKERSQGPTALTQGKKQLVVLPNLAVAQTYMNSLQLQGLKNFTAIESYLDTYQANCVTFESDSVVIIALNSTLAMIPEELLKQIETH